MTADAQRRPRGLAWIAGLLLVVCGILPPLWRAKQHADAFLVAFVVYDLGPYAKRTQWLCDGASYAHTLDERRAAIAAGLPRSRGVLGVLPNALGARASDGCERAARELDALDSKGQCPYEVIEGVPCRCGDEAYPYARCEKPQCAPLSPPRFRCLNDPW